MLIIWLKIIRRRRVEAVLKKGRFHSFPQGLRLLGVGISGWLILAYF